MEHKASARTLVFTCVAKPAAFLFWGFAALLAFYFLAGVGGAVVALWQAAGIAGFLPTASAAWLVGYLCVALGLHFAAVQVMHAAAQSKDHQGASLATFVLVTLVGAFFALGARIALRGTGIGDFAGTFVGTWALCAVGSFTSLVNLYLRHRAAKESLSTSAASPVAAS